MLIEVNIYPRRIEVVCVKPGNRLIEYVLLKLSQKPLTRERDGERLSCEIPLTAGIQAVDTIRDVVSWLRDCGLKPKVFYLDEQPDTNNTDTAALTDVDSDETEVCRSCYGRVCYCPLTSRH